jgi:hypothetical protein
MQIISNQHLTNRKKQIIKALFEQKIFEGGTKLIQFKIEPLSENTYSLTTFERYAKASREFNCTKEAQVIKWHNEGTQTITIK